MNSKARVVVGVGTSPAAAAAMRTAIAEARRRGAELLAVRARGVYGEYGTSGYETAAGESRRLTRQVIVSADTGWPQDVHIKVTTPLAAVGPALVSAADRTTDLLVIGHTPRSFGRRLLHALYRGNVAAYALQHAVCPVLTVVPTAAGPEGAWWRRRPHRVPNYVPDWMLTES